MIVDLSFWDNPTAFAGTAPYWGPIEPLENSPDFDDNGDWGKPPVEKKNNKSEK